jgi:hypothetical protein
MSNMKHGISEQEWEEYSEGRLTGEARDRIESHLIGCLACWEFYDRFCAAGERLREAGAEVRRAAPLSDRQMHTALGRVFARLGRDEAKPSAAWPANGPIRERLTQLEAVMAAMCGPRTATSALRAAARKSPARAIEQITADNWDSFLTNLASIATVMCGETGAHLVWESGQF